MYKSTRNGTPALEQVLPTPWVPHSQYLPNLDPDPPQITKEELQRRAQARVEKAAAAKAARSGGNPAQQAAAAAAAAAAHAQQIANAGSDAHSKGSDADPDSSKAGAAEAAGSAAFGPLGDGGEAAALMAALREGGGPGLPPPGTGLVPDALPGSGLGSQYKNPMYGQVSHT